MEAHLYFSATLKLHGFKTEVSVLLNDICISLLKHREGGDPDIGIFRRCVSKHKQLSRKNDEDNGTTNVEEGATKWAVLADKGYQGVQNSIRAVLPKKKPSFENLLLEARKKNKKIGTDRVIVKNVFGRLSILWAALSHR